VICIRCGRDSNYKERQRQDRICPGCGKPFAFEPRGHDRLTDRAFQAAIDAVSARGKLRWGVEHLYYEVARRRRSHALVGTALIALAVAVAVGAWSGSWPVFFAALAAGGGLVAWQFVARRRGGDYVSLPQREFDRMWKRWQEVHGAPPSVIVRAGSPPAPRALAPDVADYSFDRAVICDRARTVDLLLANNFHFENNCAVLAMNGYPAHAFDTVRRMLLRNPRLQVFVLHDATGVGCRLAHQLADDPEWFKGRAQVVDVGIRPRHARALRTLCVRPVGPGLAGHGVTPAEAAWLAAFALELAAFRPEHILKALFRAINGRADEDSFSAESDWADDAGDSFG
jgi:hypothetical protein